MQRSRDILDDPLIVLLASFGGRSHYWVQVQVFLELSTLLLVLVPGLGLGVNHRHLSMVFERGLWRTFCFS